MWVAKGQPYVACWDDADENVVQPTGDHNDGWFDSYLIWYQTRTRSQKKYADTHPHQHEASSQDTYAHRRDEALAGAVSALHVIVATLE